MGYEDTNYAFRVLFSSSLSLLVWYRDTTYCKLTMRPLTEDEAKVFFEKLSKYIGRNIKLLVERNDEPHCFRLHRNRVYYVKESIMKRAVSSERQKLITLGTCFGKFTKGGKFNLHVTALDYISQYAIYKVWLKSSQELSFLYGNNVIKSGLAKMTECTPQYIGVVVYNLKDIPLGFGVAARSTDDARQLDPTAVVVFHQADIGEYLRSEQDLI